LSARNWFSFILLGVTWGSTYTWTKIGVQEMSPFTLVSLRLLFASLGYLVYYWVKKPARPQRSFLPVFFMLGLLNIFIPFVLMSWSQKYISSGMASILNSTQPLFAILLVPLFVPEDHITLPKVAGLILGFTGVVVLMWNRASSQESGLYFIASLTTLLGALSYAGGAIYAKRKTVGLKPDIQSIGQNLAATVVTIPATFLVEKSITIPTLPISWVAVVWMGLLSSFMGSLLYFSLINDVGPTRTVLVTYLVALVGVLLGIIFLNEQPGWHLFVGGGLVIGGIIMVNTKTKKERTLQPG